MREASINVKFESMINQLKYQRIDWDQKIWHEFPPDGLGVNFVRRIGGRGSADVTTLI